MKYRVTTESDRVYDLIMYEDRPYWFVRYNKDGESVMDSGSISVMKVSSSDLVPWYFPEEWETSYLPVVGKRMYISNTDVFYVSTRVDKIEEIE